MSVNFHLLIEASNEKTATPGDVAMMLMRIRSEVLECRTRGEVHDSNGQLIGEWSYEIVEDA